MKKKSKKGSALLWILLAVCAIGLVAGTVITVKIYVDKSVSDVATSSDIKETLVNQIEKAKEQTEKIILPQEVMASSFAAYEEIATDIKPQIPKFTIASDLSDTYNLDDFYLSNAAIDKLATNNFVVTPGYNKEFFSLYEANRYDKVPNFVTTDSVLHNYHLLFNSILENLENEKLVSELKNLNSLMLAQAAKQYEEAKGTEWENAALRNLAFFSVGSKLSDSNISVPASVQDIVNQELALIAEHSQIFLSPVMNINSQATVVDGFKEDYTQYIPRGHYDKSDSLKNYFKNMMWYGRITFRLKEADEVKSAVLITLALGKEDNQASWDKIYEPTNFFVGKSDDITCFQTGELIEQVYGSNPNLSDIFSDKEKFSSFQEKIAELNPPQINSVPVFNVEIQPDREKEIKGFRFMGQRYTIDAAVFQRLIDREVTSRMLPKALDIPAAMGSQEAYDILDDLGETQYENYVNNMGKMKEYVKGLDKDVWTQNLYWGWLYTIKTNTEPKGSGYPQFMQNQAWIRKDINTYLGSYTELKHDTILYAKQAYAEMGGGPPSNKDDRGYVEPNVDLYARLASLVKMTKDGLSDRNLLTDASKQNLTIMEELVLKLKTISEKELKNEILTDEEYELIRSYGGQLEHLWLEVMKNEGVTSAADVDQHPAALITDIATDPNGSVLEDGTGYIDSIYVIVKVDDKIKIAKGGVYSYYEFIWPMNDRLTDSKWQAMLEDYDNKPKKPDWTGMYIAD